MSNQTLLARIKEARRDAIVEYYIANCVPDTLIDNQTVSLQGRIRTPDDLYEYLLLDTQISDDVTTARVAEAISSTQLYINRCMEGMEPDVAQGAGSGMAEAWKPDGFLFNWDVYNKRYSTWAGKEQLLYYAADYIEPELRYGKTQLFAELEQTLEQGQIDSDRIYDAFTDYLLEYEDLTDIKTITAYKIGTTVDDPSVITDSAQNTFYYIGYQAVTSKYYWRSSDFSKSNGVTDDSWQTRTDAWTEWQEITCGVVALNNHVAPYFFAGSLYAIWLSREQSGTATDTNAPIYSYYVNRAVRRQNASWSVLPRLPWLEGATIVPARIWAYVDVAEGLVYGLVSDSAKNWYTLKLGEPSYDGFALWDDSWSEYYVCGDVIGDTPNSRAARVDPASLSIPLNTKFEVGELVEVTLTSVSGVTIYGTAVNKNSSARTLYIGLGLNYIVDDISSSYDLPANSEAVQIQVPCIDESIGFVGNRIIFDTENEDGMRSQVDLTFKYETVAVNSYFKIASDSLEFLPTEDSTAAWSYRITTHSGHFFPLAFAESPSTLLSYATQTDTTIEGGTAIDFNGAYGLYFWEIFFHIPFLIGNRLLTEQSFDEAETAFKYLFNPAGYRDANGALETVDDGSGGKAVRYWNVVPLQTDTAWNGDMPVTVDPDVIAMADPMQYKLAVFLHFINLLIQEGDALYRQLERDTLAEAKMCYVRAQQLLGPDPVIKLDTSWQAPTVAHEADLFDTLPTSGETVSLAMMLRDVVRGADADFLPPYNQVLKTYSDTLDVRLYNLRHNLSIDGQPLSLPLYAEPVSPRELQQQAAAGNDANAAGSLGSGLATEYRFTVLLDKARSLANSVTQFGSTLLSVLERRDSEEMTLLVQSQQIQVFTQTVDIQNTNILALQASLDATKKARDGAQIRYTLYSGLAADWISDAEQTSMNMRTAGASLIASAAPFLMAGAGLAMTPNIFGLAGGGSRWGAVATATGVTMLIAGEVEEIQAARIDISEQYRRRQQEWQLQSDLASKDLEQFDDQIQSMTEQLNMAQKQLALVEMQQAQQQAVYDMQCTRFTGQELYNWMTGRLSSLYYQLYDTSVSLCLATKNALTREIAAGKLATSFTAPIWNNLYQGLLAGEGLLLELQKLENAWLTNNTRGLEVQKTVSLDTRIQSSDSNASFKANLNKALTTDAGTTVTTGAISMKLDSTTKQLAITLDIASLALDKAYGQNGKTSRFKNIGVTLPALLGPYQDIEATLTLGNTTVALSRGLQDSGLFVVDFNDPRYLPFECEPATSGTLGLVVFDADAAGAQRALAESLNDVVYHLRYTLKDA
ncbi:Tc toxin subunit A-related protein [Paraburkholderia fungorum]|uniref:Tc toxin subunit A-related protein n=1 Tax=Paraburkholderia fungorum TaxID=134537 RepID=UPI0038BC0786